MLRIIKDAIEELRAIGYNCGLRVGEKWITAGNTELVYPAFLFDPLVYKINPYDFSKDYTIKFVLGYSTNQDEQADILNIETVEYCELILQKFLIKLGTYVTVDDQRIIKLEQNPDVAQFHDLSVYGLPLSGLIVTLYVNKLTVDQC
jgi:hypothetical protein